MEHVIWGKPPGATGTFAETLLYTQCKDRAHADRVMKVLAEEHGCTDMRVQVIDGTPPDFTAAVNA